MKLMQWMGLAVIVVLALAVPAMAQGTGGGAFSGAGVGAGIGAGLVLLGAGYGFGKIGAAGLESMARQPERAAQIQLAMIIIGALLEGATLIALIMVNSALAGKLTNVPF